MSTPTFGVVDFVVFGASLVISFAVGIYFAFKNSNNNEVSFGTKNSTSDEFRLNF